jgi:hypothetical protein
MVWIDLLFVLFIALLFSAILALAFGWRHPAQQSLSVAILFLFSVFFLLVLAGGLWIGPLGPPLWGGHWLPFLVVGLAIALLLLAATAWPTQAAPPRQPLPSTTEEQLIATTAATAFGIVFWILLVLLVIAAIVGLLI